MAKDGGNGKSVLIIVENLPVPRDRRVWQEARALAQAGYRVSIICPRTAAYPCWHEVLEGIHIYRHPLPQAEEGALAYLAEYATALFWQSVLAWRVLLTRGFDIIHACNPPDMVFLVALVFKLMGKRFLFDHHDLSPELYLVKFGRRGLFYRVLLTLERWTFRSADVSLATNNSFRRVAIERGGMNPEKVFVVRSGPDLRRYKIMASNTALKMGRPYLVGYMGVMNSQDGLDYLLRAAHHIVHVLGRRDVQFALLGDGPELKRLKEAAGEMGLSDFVTFTGWANDDVALPYLNTADVCVCPDPYNEFNDRCTMNKIMEYMALGKPVVQFDLTEGRVSAGDASLYAERNDPVDLADKIVRLLDDKAERVRMGAIGRHRVERELSWQQQVTVLLRAYEAVDRPRSKPEVKREAPGESFR